MRISDWSSDVCSSDLRGSRSGIDRLKPLREPARAPFPIERLIEFARVVRALPVAFALLGPSRYSDAHMHRSHILPLAHKFRDVMLGIGFGASLGRAIDRKSVVEGKSVSVRVDLGGRWIIKKKTKFKQLET